MLRKLYLAAASLGSVAAIELTPDNWDSETAGKSVFIKFLAPWWGHCKKMKPDWDKLMKEFKGDKARLVADVDCTTKGQPLCETHGVRGYPTIKHGDPNALEDYNGARSYDALKKFAEGLKPLCSPFNIDLCDADEKAKIEGMEALGVDELASKIAEEEKKNTEAEEHFKAEVEKLQKKYNELSKEKDDKIAEVKAAGLGLMKSVQAKLKAGGKEEL